MPNVGDAYFTQRPFLSVLGILFLFLKNVWDQQIPATCDILKLMEVETSHQISYCYPHKKMQLIFEPLLRFTKFKGLNWLEFSQSDNGEVCVAFRARESLLGPQTGIVDCVEFPSGAYGKSLLTYEAMELLSPLCSVKLLLDLTAF